MYKQWNRVVNQPVPIMRLSLCRTPALQTRKRFIPQQECTWVILISAHVSLLTPRQASGPNYTQQNDREFSNLARADPGVEGDRNEQSPQPAAFCREADSLYKSFALYL